MDSRARSRFTPQRAAFAGLFARRLHLLLRPPRLLPPPVRRRSGAGGLHESRLPHHDLVHGLLRRRPHRHRGRGGGEAGARLPREGGATPPRGERGQEDAARAVMGVGRRRVVEPAAVAAGVVVRGPDRGRARSHSGAREWRTRGRPRGGAGGIGRLGVVRGGQAEASRRWEMGVVVGRVEEASGVLWFKWVAGEWGQTRRGRG